MCLRVALECLRKLMDSAYKVMVVKKKCYNNLANTCVDLTAAVNSSALETFEIFAKKCSKSILVITVLLILSLKK